MKCDSTDLWLDTLAYSKSGSLNTRRNYRRNFQKFLAFMGKTAEQILEDYKEIKDTREFKRKYARLVRAWIGSLNKKGLTKGSIRSMVGVVQSFFKYNDLPLGFVPTAQASSEYHNRDIEKPEIAHLLAISRPRDRAFFAVMAQSGLRPHELCKLRLKHLHPDLFHGTIPCKLEIPKEIAKGKYHGYFTFIGAEAVKYLKDYLKTRANVSPESYLFTKHGSELQATPKSFGHKFQRNVRKLKAKGLVSFKQRQKGKPSELRLYNLRKFFRKFASQSGRDFVNFWMGHTLGVDAHYFSRDVEFHRKLYKEKALPYLRIEKETPTETEKQIEELRAELTKLKKMEKTFEKMEPLLTLIESFEEREDLKLFIRAWLETVDYRNAQKAKEQGKPYKRIFQSSLTADQGYRMRSINDINIELAKVMQKLEELEKLTKEKKTTKKNDRKKPSKKP